MNQNHYYGSQPNFIPMQNAQPYFQYPTMNPRSDPVPGVSQTVMNQQIPVTQYNQPQQYAPNQYHNFNPASPQLQNIPQYQVPNLQNTVVPNSININSPSIQQDYLYNQPNQPAFHQNQTASNQNFIKTNQFSGNMNPQLGFNTAQPLQNIPNSPTEFYNPPQMETQQVSNQTKDTTSESVRERSQMEQQKSEEQMYEKVRTYKPTNVIGDYKCSDFPNLFTGPFRYASPIQRKPFTMKNESSRGSSVPNTAKRSQMGMMRSSKKWELRGGKYVGCFTSRTNGLQDKCPKGKCKISPTDRRK